ncbi:MAG: proton-conducting transporter membrane subunit [Roseiflexaceae bacterium]
MPQDRAGQPERILLPILAGLVVLSAVLLASQTLAPEPIRFLGITIDRMSALMSALVAGVGAVTYRFALRYLDGEPGQRRFLRWLCFTVLMAYLLMPATNLLLLFVAWSLTSLGLHRLLTFYRERREAQRPARKKFLISRLGDLALLAAIALIWQGWGTLDLEVFLARVAATGVADTTPVALLVAIAALTKSAQFPFHTWLPETMEAPTPVSALMHAGIINAGGVLLLHFAPLLAVAPLALFLLALVGALTVAVGMLSMWAQTDVKRTLAWSTVSQMGFMMVQIGLAAFPAAVLHIIGHGCYKAWSFLRTGDLPAKSAPAQPAAPARTLALMLGGSALAVPALALASWLTGFDPAHSPGELALSAVVALSIGQLWAALLAGSAHPARIATALGLTLAVSLAAFGLYRGAGLFLAPALGDLPVADSPLAWAAAVIAAATVAGLALIHALLPVLNRSTAGRAFYVHALNGFYLGLIANRLVDRIWSSFPSRRADHA